MTELRHLTGPASEILSDAVVDGDYAFLAGKCCTDAPGGEAAIGDIAAETRMTMDALKETLARVGLGFEDVVTARVFLTHPDEFDAMNAVYTTYFAPGKCPARTCVGVTWMVEGCRVEIDCVARMRKPASEAPPEQRR